MRAHNDNAKPAKPSTRPRAVIARAWLGLFPLYVVLVMFIFLWGLIPPGWEAGLMLSIPAGIFACVVAAVVARWDEV
jgi:hypothetical protein